ncbi:putative methyltransferase-domain-containing protein [Polychytrium aggregatum]|uniref:putative methyltransferase-domain-containing protein n=1 Tax=Polychytrium aggregatum TaxID=110093 RepID=UPI0022FE67D6|nr:putative methyltransferase-domain-containing protein [Polychytrium aggregatum]KAI9208153.1 putative methyltransferase-domain-containing protein [Polychytrium aggregatum]
MDPPVITLREELAAISQGTTGLRTWEAALRFTEVMISRPDIIRDRCVLELGAGMGLVGLAGAMLGARSVWMTDVNEQVLRRLSENVDLNRPLLEQGSGSLASVSALDWEGFDAADPRWERAVDTVICTDVTYDPSIVSALVRVLDFYLARGATGWMAATIRQPETFELFVSCLSDADIKYSKLDVDAIPKWFYHEEEIAGVVVLQMTKDVVP